MNHTMRDRLRDAGLVILRLGIGGLFILFGYGKITGGTEQWHQLGQAIGALGVPVFLPTFWGFMAAISEFGGGICLVLGLLTRPAACLMLITMIVATATKFAGEWTQPDFVSQLTAVAAKPLSMAIVFAALVLTGAGNFSVDRLIFRPRRKPAPEPV
jgi:putative oxidoreductase